MKRTPIKITIAILALAVLCLSCSELKNNLPTATQAGSQIHGQGWSDSSSDNFHGLAMQSIGWNLNSCQECHGKDYRGGSSKSTCLTCHNQSSGPENCTVCHGGTNAAPPQDLSGNTSVASVGVGTHQSHLNGDTLSTAIACAECHLVPSAFASPGHIDLTSGVEVQFLGDVVTSSLAGSGSAAYSDSSFTCINIYCHGNFANGNNQSVIWNDTTGQFHACGSCHGNVSQSTLGAKALPKTSLTGGTHPNSTLCYACHSSVINSVYQLNTNKHINGKIDF